jgi:hypothetical protein
MEVGMVELVGIIGHLFMVKLVMVEMVEGQVVDHMVITLVIQHLVDMV